MRFDIAERINLAGQTIALLQFTSREFALLFGGEFGDIPGNDLNFATTATAHAATNADDVYVKLARTFEQGLVAFTLAATPDGFKVDVEQWDFSSTAVSTK